MLTVDQMVAIYLETPNHQAPVTGPEADEFRAKLAAARADATKRGGYVDFPADVRSDCQKQVKSVNTAKASSESGDLGMKRPPAAID